MDNTLGSRPEIENVSDIAMEIEEMQITSRKVHSMLTALIDVIYTGASSLNTYEWAFAALSDITYELMNELEALTDKAFDTAKQVREHAEGKTT